MKGYLFLQGDDEELYCVVVDAKNLNPLEQKIYNPKYAAYTSTSFSIVKKIICLTNKNICRQVIRGRIEDCNIERRYHPITLYIGERRVLPFKIYKHFKAVQYIHSQYLFSEYKKNKYYDTDGFLYFTSCNTNNGNGYRIKECLYFIDVIFKKYIKKNQTIIINCVTKEKRIFKGILDFFEFRQRVQSDLKKHFCNVDTSKLNVIEYFHLYSVVFTKTFDINGILLSKSYFKNNKYHHFKFSDSNFIQIFKNGLISSSNNLQSLSKLKNKINVF
jgi:hypothetical protein